MIYSSINTSILKIPSFSDLGVAQQKDVTLLQQPVVAPPARPFSNNNTGRCSYHPPQHRQLLAAHTSWC